jgi:quercetin dioxygenase-like cupin family protein
MKRTLLVALLATSVAAMLAGQAAAADPRQIMVVTATFPGVAAPGRYVEFGHSLWEVAPGGRGALQSVGFMRFYTVTEGELTATVGSKTETYAVGQSFTVPDGILSQVSNPSRTTTARFMISSMSTAATAAGRGVQIPGTASETAAPRQLSGTGGNQATLPGTVNVVQWIVDYEPGFRTPNHVMNHPHVFTILSGEVTFGYLDGTVERYTAGQRAVMTPGRPGYMSNETGQMARYQITWLQTPGLGFTSAAPAASPAGGSAIRPPSTGDAGLAGTTSVSPVTTLIWSGAACAGLALLGPGLARIRSHRSR